MKQKDTQYSLNKTLQFTVTSRCSIQRNNDETLFPVWALKIVSTFGNYISKWLKYCSDNNLFQETYKDGILFLIESVHEHSYNYEVIEVALLALTNIDQNRRPTIRSEPKC